MGNTHSNHNYCPINKEDWKDQYNDIIGPMLFMSHQIKETFEKSLSSVKEIEAKFQSPDEMEKIRKQRLINNLTHLIPPEIIEDFPYLKGSQEYLMYPKSAFKMVSFDRHQAHIDPLVRFWLSEPLKEKNADDKKSTRIIDLILESFSNKIKVEKNGLKNSLFNLTIEMFADNLEIVLNDSTISGENLEEYVNNVSHIVSQLKDAGDELWTIPKVQQAFEKIATVIISTIQTDGGIERLSEHLQGIFSCLLDIIFVIGSPKLHLSFLYLIKEKREKIASVVDIKLPEALTTTNLTNIPLIWKPKHGVLEEYTLVDRTGSPSFSFGSPIKTAVFIGDSFYLDDETVVYHFSSSPSLSTLPLISSSDSICLLTPSSATPTIAPSSLSSITSAPSPPSAHHLVPSSLTAHQGPEKSASMSGSCPLLAYPEFRSLASLSALSLPSAVLITPFSLPPFTLLIVAFASEPYLLLVGDAKGYTPVFRGNEVFRGKLNMKARVVATNTLQSHIWAILREEGGTLIALAIALEEGTKHRVVALWEGDEDVEVGAGTWKVAGLGDRGNGDEIVEVLDKGRVRIRKVENILESNPSALLIDEIEGKKSSGNDIKLHNFRPQLKTFKKATQIDSEPEDIFALAGYRDPLAAADAVGTVDTTQIDQFFFRYVDFLTRQLYFEKLPVSKYSTLDDKEQVMLIKRTHAIENKTSYYNTILRLIKNLHKPKTFKDAVLLLYSLKSLENHFECLLVFHADGKTDDHIVSIKMLRKLMKYISAISTLSTYPEEESITDMTNASIERVQKLLLKQVRELLDIQAINSITEEEIIQALFKRDLAYQSVSEYLDHNGIDKGLEILKDRYSDLINKELLTISAILLEEKTTFDCSFNEFEHLQHNLCRILTAIIPLIKRLSVPDTLKEVFRQILTETTTTFKSILEVLLLKIEALKNPQNVEMIISRFDNFFKCSLTGTALSTLVLLSDSSQEIVDDNTELMMRECFTALAQFVNTLGSNLHKFTCPTTKQTESYKHEFTPRSIVLKSFKVERTKTINVKVEDISLLNQEMIIQVYGSNKISEDSEERKYFYLSMFGCESTFSELCFSHWMYDEMVIVFSNIGDIDNLLMSITIESETGSPLSILTFVNLISIGISKSSKMLGSSIAKAKNSISQTYTSHREESIVSSFLGLNTFANGVDRFQFMDIDYKLEDAEVLEKLAIAQEYFSNICMSLGVFGDSQTAIRDFAIEMQVGEYDEVVSIIKICTFLAAAKQEGQLEVILTAAEYNSLTPNQEFRSKWENLSVLDNYCSEISSLLIMEIFRKLKFILSLNSGMDDDMGDLLDQSLLPNITESNTLQAKLAIADSINALQTSRPNLERIFSDFLTTSITIDQLFDLVDRKQVLFEKINAGLVFISDVFRNISESALTWEVICLYDLIFRPELPQLEDLSHDFNGIPRFISMMQKPMLMEIFKTLISVVTSTGDKYHPEVKLLLLNSLKHHFKSRDAAVVACIDFTRIWKANSNDKGRILASILELSRSILEFSTNSLNNKSEKIEGEFIAEILDGCLKGILWKLDDLNEKILSINTELTISGYEKYIDSRLYKSLPKVLANILMTKNMDSSKYIFDGIIRENKQTEDHALQNIQEDNQNDNDDDMGACLSHLFNSSEEENDIPTVVEQVSQPAPAPLPTPVQEPQQDNDMFGCLFEQSEEAEPVNTPQPHITENTENVFYQFQNPLMSSEARAIFSQIKNGKEISLLTDSIEKIIGMIYVFARELPNKIFLLLKANDNRLKAILQLGIQFKHLGIQRIIANLFSAFSEEVWEGNELDGFKELISSSFLKFYNKNEIYNSYIDGLNMIMKSMMKKAGSYPHRVAIDALKVIHEQDPNATLTLFFKMDPNRTLPGDRIMVGKDEEVIALSNPFKTNIMSQSGDYRGIYAYMSGINAIRMTEVTESNYLQDEFDYSALNILLEEVQFEEKAKSEKNPVIKRMMVIVLLSSVVSTTVGCLDKRNKILKDSMITLNELNINDRIEPTPKMTYLIQNAPDPSIKPPQSIISLRNKYLGVCRSPHARGMESLRYLDRVIYDLVSLDDTIEESDSDLITRLSELVESHPEERSILEFANKLSCMIDAGEFIWNNKTSIPIFKTDGLSDFARKRIEDLTIKLQHHVVSPETPFKTKEMEQLGRWLSICNSEELTLREGFRIKLSTDEDYRRSQKNTDKLWFELEFDSSCLPLPLPFPSFSLTLTSPSWPSLSLPVPSISSLEAFPPRTGAILRFSGDSGHFAVFGEIDEKELRSEFGTDARLEVREWGAEVWHGHYSPQNQLETPILNKTAVYVAQEGHILRTEIQQPETTPRIAGKVVGVVEGEEQGREAAVAVLEEILVCLHKINKDEAKLQDVKDEVAKRLPENSNADILDRIVIQKDEYIVIDLKELENGLVLPSKELTKIRFLLSPTTLTQDILDEIGIKPEITSDSEREDLIKIGKEFIRSEFLKFISENKGMAISSELLLLKKELSEDEASEWRPEMLRQKKLVNIVDKETMPSIPTRLPDYDAADHRYIDLGVLLMLYSYNSFEIPEYMKSIWRRSLTMDSNLDWFEIKLIDPIAYNSVQNLHKMKTCPRAISIESYHEIKSFSSVLRGQELP